MNLKDIMSPIDTFYGPGDSLINVAKSLAENHHSCGLICEYDKPIGIITERDVVRLLANQTDIDVAIKEVMTQQPICVDADTELVDALDLAKSRSLRHLPVVDATQRLVGIVTHSDIVKALLASIEHSDASPGQSRSLYILAIEDPLTGLPNRRAMNIDLRHAAAVAKRRSEYYSIAVIDVDYFKKFNDHYGHGAGDEALLKIAKLLRGNLRAADKLFRYDGEKFLLLMPFTPIEGAVIASKRICQTISQKKYPHESSPLGHLTVSIGVASGATDNWELIIELADSALYDAKDGGRNTVRAIEPAEDSDFWDLGKRLELEEPGTRRRRSDHDNNHES